MADPNPNPNPNPDGFSLESDDMSTFLQSLLQASTLPSSSTPQYHLQHQQLPEEIRRQFYEPVVFPDCSSGLDFSFRADCYAPDDTDRSRSTFSGAIASSVEEIGDFNCEIEDASDLQRSSDPCRNSNSSSKRTRGADFHNISEKRRRQRINEKMKALQKLIPNSNKTDKASMLDEAIEYLKQLQLQVQMLALRNGSTLQPFYIPGVMHSAQPTSAGLYYNMGEGLPSSSRGAGSLTAHQELPVQTIYNASNRCASSEQKLCVPSALNHGNSESSFAIEPSPSTHYRPFNRVTPSKELYGGTKLSQLQMDMGRCGDESSSGVSS